MDTDTALHTLHLALIHERDPLRRAGVHFELGRRAMEAGRLHVAALHMQEALFFDGRLALARRTLQRLRRWRGSTGASTL